MRSKIADFSYHTHMYLMSPLTGFPFQTISISLFTCVLITADVLLSVVASIAATEAVVSVVFHSSCLGRSWSSETRNNKKCLELWTMDVINECCLYFYFMLPVSCWKSNFLRKFSCSSIVCHFGFGNMWNVCDNYLFLLVKLIKFFPLLFYILIPVMVNKDFQ